MVGLDTSDDAGVYQINEETALVQTLDYFTPIVDDPYMFGQIAAANALSDVYAMGGTPITVMNIVGFPVNNLDKSILADILAGSSDKVRESGAALAGGHSIDDQEPKFGLSVTGTVHPKKILANVGAKPGDKLILTKPIGVGILTTAIKRDLLDKETTDHVMKVMATLNKKAQEAMEPYNVHACTDVTGFGLLGHASEMAEGSQVGMTLRYNQIPILPQTKELAEQGVVPGGSKKNHQWLADRVEYSSSISEVEQIMLCDAITSGGLLIAAPEEDAKAIQNKLEDTDIQSAIIGEVTESNPGSIKVI